MVVVVGTGGSTVGGVEEVVGKGFECEVKDERVCWESIGCTDSGCQRAQEWR